MVPELFYKNVAESLYIENTGTMPTIGYLMCSKFWTPYYLNISMQSANPVWPDMITETLYVKSLKNGSNMRMTFSTHKQKSPLKNPLFGGTVH